MSGTLSREQFIAVMSQGSSPEQARLVIDAALERLGWQSKTEFEREDALTVSQTVAALTAESLALSDDPASRQMAEGLRMMMRAAES